MASSRRLGAEATLSHWKYHHCRGPGMSKTPLDDADRGRPERLSHVTERLPSRFGVVEADRVRDRRRLQANGGFH